MQWLAHSQSLSRNKIITLLQRELPLCFSAKPKPLAYNIKKTLLDYYRFETRFSPQALLSALQDYMDSKEYLQVLIPGTSRVDIYGIPAGIVTQQEAWQSKALLNSQNIIKSIAELESDLTCHKDATTMGA